MRGSRVLFRCRSRRERSCRTSVLPEATLKLLVPVVARSSIVGKASFGVGLVISWSTRRSCVLRDEAFKDERTMAFRDKGAPNPYCHVVAPWNEKEIHHDSHEPGRDDRSAEAGSLSLARLGRRADDDRVAADQLALRRGQGDALGDLAIPIRPARRPSRG